MQFRVFSASLALAIVVAGCTGGSSVTPTGSTSPRQPVAAQRHVNVSHNPSGRRVLDASGNLVDGGFESGGFANWQQCGDVNASIETSVIHSGTYAEQSGSTSSEPNGDAGVCQSVVVPTGGTLTFWTKQSTNETSTKYAYQEADLLDASGNVLDNLYTVASTGGWTQRTYDVSAYAGQTVYVY
ncbi:MAG: hypothetical protein JO225_04855, partial [Candidatus Eremiobacteraeota bacterium]|nr:hypothetical protein [Candidatus Eremiobacteraeota bacterium]